MHENVDGRGCHGTVLCSGKSGTLGIRQGGIVEHTVACLTHILEARANAFTCTQDTLTACFKTETLSLYAHTSLALRSVLCE